MKSSVSGLSFLVLASVAFALVDCGGTPDVLIDKGDAGGSVGEGGSAGTSTADGGTGLGIIVTGGTAGTAGCAGESCGGGSGGAPVEPTCGDGAINQASERCDDGNTDSGDGCTGNCDAVEVNFACPNPGQLCVSTIKCGDSRITGTETCDDGNANPDDGCSKDCLIEPGWACPIPGLRCEAAKCGDGIIKGFEECEFTTPTPPEGCGSDCKITSGYACDPEKHTCARTLCGDGKVERGEQCEDSNAFPFDGCYQCQREPVCTAGACKSVCGDGQRFEDEGCDDGNNRAGDGCSSDCKKESGYNCTDIAGQPPEVITLPVVFRDFIARGQETSADAAFQGHPDFNRNSSQSVRGIVEENLGADGRPVYACPDPDAGGDPSKGCTQNPGRLSTKTVVSTKKNYDQWYRNVDGVNITAAGSVSLTRVAGTGEYVFDSLTTEDGKSFFDPFNAGGQASSNGWVGLSKEQLADCGAGVPKARDRNVSFTSETHFWFEYQGGESFEFSGDDDTWVFLNGKLAIDLGGLHVRQAGSFVLDADTDGAGADTADGTGRIVLPDINGNGDGDDRPTKNFGLRDGGVYEVVVFQAERNQCQSNFKVTLKNFNRPKSSCKSKCGDGIVASDEVCDEGDKNSDEYGHCSKTCKRGEYCGDGKKNGPEACDNGVNLSQYSNTPDGDACAPGCVKPPHCGDGQVQSGKEECDDGKNDGGYGECAPGCKYGERCGDGIQQTEAGEQCDDHNRESGDGCSANCKNEIPK